MTWAVLCVLGAAGSSLCANENEYDDNYGNEISLDQQRGEFCLFDSVICKLFDWIDWE